MSVVKLGNARWDTSFNSRLQPLQIGLPTLITNSSLLKLDYGYGTTNNNGNVQTQTITLGATAMSQSYVYDGLNRLLSASENSGANWSQTYGYDRYGNRWVSSSTGYTLSSLTPQSQGAFNAGNNRLLASGYDNAGNQTVDAQSRTFTYDAENRQITFNGTTGQYFYDADGHRVKKMDASGTTVFVYNAGGQLIAEYHSDPVPPPAGGGGTSYLTTDHLGSTRVVTKQDGTVKARYDYLPFGEELGATIGQRTTGMGYNLADSTRQKFTQKERDNESGLDYFLARYYSSEQGRFTSGDPMISSGRVDDPQTWNRYNYGLNNPLKYIDPFGLAVTCTYNGESISCAEAYDRIAKGQFETLTYVVNGVKQTVSKADYYDSLPASSDATSVRIGARFNESGFQASIAPILQRIRTQLDQEDRETLAGTGGDFGGAGATDICCGGNSGNSPTLNIGSRQLQKKFKHAGDFGVSGKYNRANAARFERAIRDHVDDPGSKPVFGTYRGAPAIIYVNPTTGQAVITDRSGNLISAWKLSAQQLQHVLTTGKLGGGN